MKRSLILAAALAAIVVLWAAPDIKTGPDVGAPIPEFSAQDQNGQTQTFASLRGPHGLMLVFVRSADW